MRNISSLATSGKLQITGNRGDLAPTENQIKAIKFLVYNYKVTVSTKSLKNRRDTSQLITKIHDAISEGKIEERKSRPTNCKVTNVDGVYKLVQVIEEKKDLNDTEHELNGFAKFIEETNAREHEKFMKQHEEWLKKQESKRK